MHLAGPVTRVVSLAPSLTEIIFAAGGGHMVAGVTTADDYPPAVNTLPTFSALPVDYENIVALEPDIVFASDQINSARDAQSFAALGIPVYFFSISGINNMLDAIDRMASLLSTETSVSDSLRHSLDSLSQLVHQFSHRPTTLMLVSDETLYSFGQGSYIHDLVARAGGTSVTAQLARRAPVLSDEYVLIKKPQVIIGAFGEDYEASDLMMKHPTWDVVPAVATSKVHSIDAGMFYRPGPRLVQGTWQLARLLHPHLTP